MCGEAPVTPPAGALDVDDRLMLKIMDYANGVRPLSKENRIVFLMQTQLM